MRLRRTQANVGMLGVVVMLGLIAGIGGVAYRDAALVRVSEQRAFREAVATVRLHEGTAVTEPSGGASLVWSGALGSWHRDWKVSLSGNLGGTFARFVVYVNAQNGSFEGVYQVLEPPPSGD